MAIAKKDMIDVTLEVSELSSQWLMWADRGGNRYSISLDMDGKPHGASSWAGKGKAGLPVICKNPPLNLGRYDEGYFPTRYLLLAAHPEVAAVLAELATPEAIAKGRADAEVSRLQKDAEARAERARALRAAMLAWGADIGHTTMVSDLLDYASDDQVIALQVAVRP